MMATFRQTFVNTDLVWAVLAVGVLGVVGIVVFMRPVAEWPVDHPAKVYSSSTNTFWHGDVSTARAQFVALLEHRRDALSERQIRMLQRRITVADKALTLGVPAIERYVKQAERVLADAMLLPDTPDGRQLARVYVVQVMGSLEHAARVAKTNANYNYLFARCLSHLAQRNEARPFLERATRLSPDDPRQLALWAIWYDDEGKKDESLLLARRAITSATLDRQARRTCCRIAVNSGEPTDAEAAFKVALSSMGDERDYAESLAELFTAYPAYREKLERAASVIPSRTTTSFMGSPLPQ